MTNEQLVSGDTDSSHGHLRALRGDDDPGLPGPDQRQRRLRSPFFAGASSDGSKVFFRTDEQLVSGDTDDASQDVYERSGGTTKLVSVEVIPPQTTIEAGPSGGTNDPTPTFAFSSSEAGSSFQCKLDAGAYAACSSPRTTAHLADGPHTFSVRATDPAGNVDPTPATRTFTVKTAAVSVSGSTLVVTAAPGAKDNLRISRPSPRPCG